jgi:glycyl-tRNA synthetase beta chain
MTPSDEFTGRSVAPQRQGELLLELLSEEIPARMQRRAIEDLTRLLRDKLAQAEIPAAQLHGYVTPRRLAVIAESIPATQPDRTEERRGPRVGAPQPALDGFLRSAGLGSIDECEIRDTGRGEFYFAVVKRSGRPAAEVLPDLVKAAIAELPWPKSMRWPGSSLRWVRPLTSVLCLYDGEVLPLALDGVPVGRTTSGHRFLSPGEICVGNAAEYLEKLQHAYVIVDHNRRKEVIRADLDRQAAELGVAVKTDPGLLDEVTGLAEFPVVLAGAIDADFMTLPPEVLQTAMRVHQKYFSCLDRDGGPAPHFLFVTNNLTDDGGKTIIAGNERVLRARLADARFFWDQDRKVRFEDRVDALKDRVYHEKLGNLFDKAERMELLAEFLVEYVPGADRRRSQRGAFLAKADLSTGMVGEFPELQGIMGRYYALCDGEPREVAGAIAEHYKPLGPNDACPTTPDSIVVALADKLDALFAFVWINEKPSGSRDPFALRRAAQGIIRIILENKLRLPLTQAFRCVHFIFTRHQIESQTATGKSRYRGVGPFVSDVTPELMELIEDRLKVHLRGEGFGFIGEVKLLRLRHDMIAAVFALAEDDLVRLLARAAELAAFLATDDGTNLLVAYRRASKIVAIEERRDGRSYDGEVDPRLVQQREEQVLTSRLGQVSVLTETALAREEFAKAMIELARLRQPVDAFFDKVTVNTDVPELRENRLRLLSRIRATMNRVADFSQIEG